MEHYLSNKHIHVFYSLRFFWSFFNGQSMLVVDGQVDIIGVLLESGVNAMIYETWVKSLYFNRDTLPGKHGVSVRLLVR